MIKNYLFKFGVALLLLFSTVAYSQNCTPINVSGFNFDAVAEAAPAATHTTGPIDNSNSVMYSRNYGIANGYSRGLPESRDYVSGTFSYKLQPYNQNNVLRLTAGQSGTLTFTTPSSYTKLSLLGFNAEQSGYFDYTVNFTDGTSVTGTTAFPDWFNGSPYVAIGIGNVGRQDSGGNHVTYNPRIYKIDIDLTGADAFKKVANIAFTTIFTNSQGMHVLAVSGISNVKIDPGQCGAVVNYSLPNENVSLPKVLILGSVSDNNFNDDIKNNLLSTNLFSTVDAFNTASSTPNLALLQQYDVVLLYSNITPLNAVAFGDTLAQFIEGGGGVVDAYSDAASGFGTLGQYNANYRVLVPGSYSLGTVLTLGAVAAPTHPIMNGVTYYNGGSGSYRVTSSNISPGSYIVAKYSNNDLFIVAKENVGPSHTKRATLNFFPVSSAAISGSWDKNTTDGLKIITNALAWVASTYTQTSGLASGSLFPIGTTTNTFTYIDNNNVEQTFSFDITVVDNVAPVAIAKNIMVTLNASGTVTILPADVNNASTDNCGPLVFSLDKTTFNCTNIGANTVLLTATDKSGNTATATAVVTVQSTLAVTGTQTNVLCNGAATGIATATVTGGATPYTYLWNNAQTTATATGLIAGNYSVTITDNNGCVKTQTFTITEPATAITAIVGSKTDVLCNGGATGSATVNVTGGTGAYTYSWSPSGGTAATATGLTAGTYVVTVKDANLCETTQSFTITEPATAITATVGAKTDVLCHGAATGSATVNVTGGTGAYTYSWSPSGGTAATATGLTAGTYVVTVKDANLCETTQSFTITQPTALTATVGAKTDVLCNGAATGAATVNATGGTGTYTYSWSPSGGTAATATGLTAGTYVVTVKDANLCETTQSFTITQPTAITATVGAKTDVLCHGAATGSATVNVTGGTGTYTYSWSPSGGTAATATGLTAGTYVVTVKDANLCETTQSFTITQPTVLTATVGAKTDVLCNGAATGSATVNVTGGTGAYTYLWSPSGGTAATATGLTAGTYVVTVKDANLCETTQSFTITQPTALIATVGAQTDVLCNGAATGSATVNVTGGTGAYTYLWSPSGGTAATATGLTAGTYVVTVKDANLCETTQSFTITQPTAVTATVGAKTDVLCNGAATGSATVNVTGGTGAYTYSWSPSGGTAATATGLTAGTYVVTVKDANLCETTQSFTITQPTVLTATVGAKTDVLCHGAATGAATVNATGGTGAYTYLWSPSGGTAATATGLTAGTYVVTVKDANLCETTQSFTIAQPLQPLVTTPNTSQTNVSCNGGSNGSASIAVNGGTAPYTYIWSNGQTTATATALTAGIYTVTVTDAHGCTLTESFNISEPTVLEAVAGTQVNVSCFGGNNASATVNVTGGTGAYSYSWNTVPVQTNATATGLAAGTYMVTVKDANLCETTQLFTITQPDILTAVITADNVDEVLCFGAATGSATVTVTGGTQNYTYHWNTLPVQTTPTATGLKAGTYNVVVTDGNGCSANASVTITQPATAVSLTTTQVNVTCYGGNDGSLSVTPAGGVGPYTYEWIPAVSTTNSASGLTVGNYKVVVTDANGCIDLRYLSLTSPSELRGVASFTNVVCNGDNSGTASVTVTGGVAPYTYLWSNGSTTSAIQNLSANTYSVIVTDAHNCTFSASVTIVQQEAVIITGQPADVSVTSGESGAFTVAAQNATTYQWQISTDGGITWTNVLNGGAQPNYSGATTSRLSLENIRFYLNGSKFRVVVSQGGNCTVISAAANLTVAPILGLEDGIKLDMSIFPNPASTEVFVKIPDYVSHNNLKIIMYDLNGRIVRPEQLITSDNYRIDVSGLESAVYIITITSDTGKTDKKVIIAKNL